MEFSKFIKHPKRSTDLLNTTQKTQIFYPLHRKKLLRLILHNGNNKKKLFQPVARILLLNVSNQYNAYNLIL